MSEYSQVFGGAAGLSVHWIGTFERNTAIPLATFAYLSEHLADPAEHRLYLDRGTETLDAMYGPSFDFGGEVIRAVATRTRITCSGYSRVPITVRRRGLKGW
jgi:hypothetical protein